MRLRLILQPAWVRFVVWGLFLAVWWGVFTSLQSGYEFESSFLSAIFFGAALGGYFTATTQGMHRAAQEAIAGLDQSERSDAIHAVLRGVAPADPDVRASAARLGKICLRDRTADQLKRAEIWSGITFGVLFAGSVAGAVAFSNDRLPFVMVAVLAAILLPVSLVSSRRIRRNVALLAEPPD
jgi:Flp pilus assembly protein TadB